MCQNVANIILRIFLTDNSAKILVYKPFSLEKKKTIFHEFSKTYEFNTYVYSRNHEITCMRYFSIINPEILVESTSLKGSKWINAF